MTGKYTDRFYWKDIVKAGFGKYLILKELSDGPTHGYALIRKIGEHTKEFYRPSEGAVYPLLREFMQCGCVSMRLCVVRGRERKEYVLTTQGRKVLKIAEGVWRTAVKFLPSP